MFVPYRRIGNETEARVRKQYEEQGKQEGIVIRQDSGAHPFNPNHHSCVLSYSPLPPPLVDHTILHYTANKVPVGIQYKCLVPMYVFPENETVRPRYFQNIIIIFSLRISTFTYVSVSNLYIFLGGPMVGNWNT
jgi:hypothetical protein